MSKTIGYAGATLTQPLQAMRVGARSNALAAVMSETVRAVTAEEIAAIPIYFSQEKQP